MGMDGGDSFGREIVAQISPPKARPNASARSVQAFIYAVPIGVLGGLIGLGGAEFRLPVLVGPLRYPARQAVPLNLAVSLVTLTASLVIRGRTLSFSPVRPFLPGVLAIMVGAIVAAFVGTGIARRLSEERLEQVILFLLLGIGSALLIEGFLPQRVPALLPANDLAWVAAGLSFGLAIGLVSSLLGVAGGELIIPTLIFAYGMEVKAAGTASLMISLPTVCVGLARYAHRGAFRGRRPLCETVAPMGVGSVIGAVIGGVLVGLIPVGVLKISLGLILISSAARTFRRHRKPHVAQAGAVHEA